jgi:hypothetical protein
MLLEQKKHLLHVVFLWLLVLSFEFDWSDWRKKMESGTRNPHKKKWGCMEDRHFKFR